MFEFINPIPLVLTQGTVTVNVMFCLRIELIGFDPEVAILELQGDCVGM